MAKNTAVYGLYKTRMQVSDEVDEMLDAGFRTEDISVLLPENEGTKEFAHEKQTKAPEGPRPEPPPAESSAVLWACSRVSEPSPFQGFGPFIAAGPIMAGLAGLGVGGAVGGLVGGLVGMGIPEYEAKRYEGLIKQGGILASIHCDNSEWVDRAKQILKDTGAEDISSTGEAGADYAKSDVPKTRTSGGGQYEL